MRQLIDRARYGPNVDSTHSVIATNHGTLINRYPAKCGTPGADLRAHNHTSTRRRTRPLYAYKCVIDDRWRADL